MESRQTQEIVLIRGLPGSGKTTLAKQFTMHVHVETDMYFEKDGMYQYNPADIKKAHAWCLEQAKFALQSGRNVVVSNTFIRRWEMEPYIQLGVPVREITAMGSYSNVHGVPNKKIEMMRANWEP